MLFRSFKKGNLYTILGRTLSGKTTFLKTIAGLLNPDSGSMRFEDKNFSKIPVWERNVAMVYQQFINYPHMNVYENIIFPLKQRKVSDEQIKKDVNEALNTVGLVGFENRKIQELSGGQQQRVALARSLAKKAKILLLDEPLVNLDYKLREQLREEFKRIFSEGFSQETILIYSTTDPQEVMELNGEVIVLDEGKILHTGSSEYLKDKSNFDIKYIVKFSKDIDTNISIDNLKTKFIDSKTIEVLIQDSNESSSIFKQIKELENVISIALHKPNLEDTFLALTGKQLIEKI